MKLQTHRFAPVAWFFHVGIAIWSTALFAAPPLSQPHVLVSDYSFSGSIQRFDAATGAFIDLLAAGIIQPNEMQIGPDGHLYVNSSEFIGTRFGRILRFNLHTGDTLGIAASTGGEPIRGFEFGPNGNLFVATPNDGRVVEFDPMGTKVRDFISGLSTPIAIRFGPDGDLYVARGHHQLSPNENVLRFDGIMGTAKGVFTSDGIGTPQNLLFDSAGNLYVANQTGANDVTKYSRSGSRITTFVTGKFLNPQGLAFLP